MSAEEIFVTRRIMVVLALTFLTPYFSYIPKATLSSVIICAAIFMVEVNISRLIWKMSKIDFIPLIVTFLSCLLLEFEIGILIVIAVDIILILYNVARPKIEIEQIDGCEYSKITPMSYVFYPSSEHLREKILKSTIKNPKSKIVIMDCSRITKTDFTAIKCIGALAEDLNKKGHMIAFFRIDPDLSKLFGKVCRNYTVAYTDDDLFAILKSRHEEELNNTSGNVLANGHVLSAPNNAISSV